MATRLNTVQTFDNRLRACDQAIGRLRKAPIERERPLGVPLVVVIIVVVRHDPERAPPRQNPGHARQQGARPPGTTADVEDARALRQGEQLENGCKISQKPRRLVGIRAAKRLIVQPHAV